MKNKVCFFHKEPTKTEDMSAEELLDLINEMKKDENYILGIGLSAKTISCVRSDFANKKQYLIGLLHKKIDEL